MKKKDSSTAIYIAMFVLIYLKIIDFDNLGVLDACILIAFAIMVGQKIYKKFGR